MKALGYALLAAGVLLLVFGIQGYHSASSGISRFFTGEPTNHTLSLIIGGVAAAISGLVMLGRE